MQQQTKLFMFRLVRFVTAMAMLGSVIGAAFHFFAVMFNTVMTSEELVAMFRHHGFWIFTFVSIACFAYLIKKWANRKAIKVMEMSKERTGDVIRIH